MLSIVLLSCSSDKKELFEITDSFVNSLNSDVESYGILSSKDHIRTTSDSVYRVMPVGRLINVKILENTGGQEYESLINDLKEYYKGNSKVNDVYKINAGTVMIDCRNN